MHRKSCPRDLFGFCQIALLGHSRCPDRQGGCSVADPAKAWEALRAQRIRQAFRKHRARNPYKAATGKVRS